MESRLIALLSVLITGIYYLPVLFDCLNAEFVSFGLISADNRQSNVVENLAYQNATIFLCTSVEKFFLGSTLRASVLSIFNTTFDLPHRFEEVIACAEQSSKNRKPVCVHVPLFAAISNGSAIKKRSFSWVSN